MKTPIKFALLGGDLTTEDNDYTEWEEFLSAATGVFSQIPVMPAKGNHDGELFLSSLPCLKTGLRAYLAIVLFFDGDAHFVVLDTSNIITDAQAMAAGGLQTPQGVKFGLSPPSLQNFDNKP